MRSEMVAASNPLPNSSAWGDLWVYPNMNTKTPSPDAILGSARQAARDAAPWVVRLARLGLATKGVVYFTIGLLAVLAAAHAGGKTMDAYGALGVIGSVPFGKVLLGVAGVGLIGYSLWRLILAFFNPEHEANDAKGYAHRVGYVCSAAAYAGLAFASFKAISSGDERMSDHTTQSQIARVLSGPIGWELVVFAGAAMLIVALAQFNEAYRADFARMLALESLDEKLRKMIIVLARLGLAARGIVFGVIGLFLIPAGLHQNADRAKGVGGALKALGQQALGPALLGIVAAGLAAYGISMIVESRYRRISV